MRRKILVLSADDAVLKQVAGLLGGHFLVRPFRSSGHALAHLSEAADVFAFIAEQRTGGADGVDVLDTVRTLRPDVRRVMLTDYTDLAHLVRGLHGGIIQQVLQKPISGPELTAMIVPPNPVVTKGQ